jgi:hypothetical protein
MAMARHAFEQGDWLTGEPEVITHRQQGRPLEPGGVSLTAQKTTPPLRRSSATNKPSKKGARGPLSAVRYPFGAQAAASGSASIRRANEALVCSSVISL